LAAEVGEAESLGEEGQHLTERLLASIRNDDLETISLILSEVQQR